MFGHWGNYYMTKIVSLKKIRNEKCGLLSRIFPNKQQNQL